MVETVQVPTSDDPAAEAKAKQEHEDKMIQLADGAERNVDNESTTIEETPDSDREEWLPEKFKTKEDLLKSYEELEKKLSSQPKQKTEETTEEETPPEQPSLNADLFEEMNQQYFNDGELSEDNYKRLEASGIPRNIVDSYIDGYNAKVTQTRNDVLQTVGGEEVFNNMVDWAKQNLSPDEITAYNQSTAGTPEQAKLAIHGLYAKYSKDTGITPNLVEGGEKSNSGRDVYQSRQQITDAMSDPRYKTDPAYRKSVEQKLYRSDIL